jgi:hypothetical protein
MKVFVVAVALIAGCGGIDGSGYPITPGGTGSGGGHGAPDAAIDASPDGASGMIAGKVCLLTELRDLTSCATTGADGLTVALGAGTATTEADGSFTMAIPAGNPTVWRVSGTTTAGDAIVPSSMVFGTDTTLPAIRATAYAEMQVANGVIAQAGQGDLMIRVTEAGAALAGVTATVAPAIAGAILYDGQSSDAWVQDMTGAFGTIWIPGEAMGAAIVTITPPGATGTTDLPASTVIDGGITFVEYEVL